MSIVLSDYVEVPSLLKWLDVDPTFDPEWTSWVFKRPYTFCPTISSVVGQIGGLDYHRTIVASEELGQLLANHAAYRGKGIDEKLSPEQIRYAAGLKREGGKLRPVRLDKALLTVFSLNKALENLKKPTATHTIFISAFNIHGLSKFFAAADADKKNKLREIVSKGTQQSASFVGDFLKGNKASLDFTIAAYDILIGEGEAKDALPTSLQEAIETPTQKFTTAALGEDFSKTRSSELPSPFKRPSKD